MLNFRKLRQDFASSILKEGKELYDKKLVLSAKILHLDGKSIRLSCRVRSLFDNVYESEIEIDRKESIAIDSNCDCSYSYDCQHIVASLFHLEERFDEIVVEYSTASGQSLEKVDDKIKLELKKTFAEAATKECLRKDQVYQKEVLREYIVSAEVLGSSPFFLPIESFEEDKAELLIVFCAAFQKNTDFQLFLRLPARSKPLFISNVKAFLDAIYYREPLLLNGKKYFFTFNSFSPEEREILTLLLHDTRYSASTDEKHMRTGQIESEALGKLLAKIFELSLSKKHISSEPLPLLPLFSGHLEEPLFFSNIAADIQFSIDHLKLPASSFLLKPVIAIDEEIIDLKDVLFFESTKPGLLFKNTYYRFRPEITRTHLKSLISIANMVIPEPLFGTFIENALPVLKNFAKVTNAKVISQFVTLPFAQEVQGKCLINYLNGELEAELFFIYDGVEIPALPSKLEYSHLASFVRREGTLARNLVEEKKLIEEVFEDFQYSEKEGVFKAKSEKKIVEFMTDIIPKHQSRIKFECPENLSEQFIYDDTNFELHLKEGGRIDSYEVELRVDGDLKGTSIDLLWDCISTKKRFLELQAPQIKEKKGKAKIPRILVLDLKKIAPLIQIFDEIGIKKIDSHTVMRPLWSLTSLNAPYFSKLPMKFSITSQLQEIQKQILGETSLEPKKIPNQIKASLRKYQVEGVNWLERLRRMHLNGILADDMGLGKTLQAICAITQSKEEKKDSLSLIVTPTSLVHNWKEEFNKFHGSLKVLVVDSIPTQRKKALKEARDYDVIITSYNLLQKDVDIYKEIQFDYAILDEAQHIKNRTTRNAKSVKMIQAVHRLILTGTPIENSLEELWSLFDFLMPGLLSTYDRFVEKYIKQNTYSLLPKDNVDSLKKKVSPFILRRMKEDVLDDLPPVSEIFYHCHLTDVQKELYHSYAASAKEELSRLVKKEGFEKIQIHVLATLTRLKQICCHPAIFAKEKVEIGDSAKYDMLMELLPTLIEGKHKTVIFSQYTKMLTIMREDLEQKGIRFSYLDGSSKNRLEIVKNFNEDLEIPVFLVSLKAGGAGLNLVGADTVIHYDMWWNPAVENQATDRVHRLGQKKSVSSYKLITLNTIEEKIQNLQNRKKGLVKKVIGSDEEAISKLTWEEVLELLQT